MIEQIIIFALIAFIVGFVAGVLIVNPPTFSSGLFHPQIIADLPVVRREFTWQLISNSLISPIVDKENVNNIIQILHNGKPLYNVNLIILRLWNIGNVPIFLQDYENNNPIEIKFGEKVELLDVEILETVPRSLEDKAKAVLKLNDGSVLLGPLFFDGSDSITLKLMVANFNSEITVNAQIAGIKQILSYTS